MDNNEKKNLSEKKNTDKKGKNNSKTKLIVIIGAVIAVALIVVIVLALTLGGADKSPAGDDTGADVVVDNDTGFVPETSGTENAPAGDDTNADTNGKNTDPATENADPAVSDTTPSGEDPDTSGLTVEIDPGDLEPVEEETTTQIVVEQGKTASDWPEVLPDVIPAFKGSLSFNNNCSYELSDTQEIWYMAWDTNQADYDAWMTEIESAGFKNNGTVTTFWADGEYVLDIMTEELDTGLWVSMDVYHAFDVVYPETIAASIPEFETSGTLEYWYDDPEKCVIRMHYVNAPEWGAELNEYCMKLKDLGFTMGPESATITVNGTEFTIHWDGEFCFGSNMIAISY